jgi:hypothetical protein
MKIPLLRNHLLQLSQVHDGFVVQRLLPQPDFSGHDAWHFTSLDVSIHFFTNLDAQIKKHATYPISGLKQKSRRQHWLYMLTGMPFYAPPVPSRANDTNGHKTARRLGKTRILNPRRQA